MGHEQSKENKITTEKKEEEEEEDKKSYLLRKETFFYKLANSLLADAAALKENFHEPIEDSIMEKYRELKGNLIYIEVIMRGLEKEGVVLDEDLTNKLKDLMAVFQTGVFNNRLFPRDNEMLVSLSEISEKINDERQMRKIRAKREKEEQLFVDFEEVYKKDGVSQEELDKAYYAFAKGVYSLLRSESSDYRDGSFAGAIAWNNREEEIEAKFKKQFPNYNAPCSLNQAERK